MELSLKRETKLVIGQRMYQSMSFLQMGAEELNDYLNELCLENPMLEQSPPAELVPRLLYKGFGGIKRVSDGEIDLPIPDKRHRTLRDDLHEQLLTMKLDSKINRCLRFLIINLDERGFLDRGIKNSDCWRRDAETFEKALELLRRLEPTGVGAFDMSECLCLQLEHMGMGGSTAWKICRNYLEHLSKSHINHIAKQLNVPEAEIMSARELISGLNPIPSNGYDDGSSAAWIVPDVEVELENGKVSVATGERYMPEYNLSPIYSELAENESLTDTDREYFREKINQAQWAVDCVKRRRDTLVRCTTAIAEVQKNFFETGEASAMKPCSMSDLAYMLEVHPSTVSRAVKDKYIACRWGVFPMSRFFTADVGGSTQKDIIKALGELIAAEDKSNPLSDSDISSKLKAMGYDIARRTVAKYRDIAGIPSATGRRIR